MLFPILTGWFLFAQAPPPPPLPYPMSGVFFALMAFTLVVAGMIYITRSARRERELEHAERLKALEMGRTLPKDAPFWTPNNLCVAIGGVMPLALFVMAYFISQDNRELLPYVWPVAGALGGIGIICGTLVALILPSVNRHEPHHAAAPVKDRVDPDSYDTAGRRGWDAVPGAQESSHAHV